MQKPYTRKIISILSVFVLIIPMFILPSCASGYDAEKCNELTSKIQNHETLSQGEYSDMLEQYDYILTYLKERMEKVAAEPDEFKRAEASRALQDDKDYMERFTYMMTIGSVLYRADVNSLFDTENKERYDLVNARADEFARLAEQI